MKREMGAPFRGLFIAGTDTGVGKTIVAAGLVAALRARGEQIGVWKPVQSGTSQHDPDSDGCRLTRLSGVTDRVEEVAPLSFSAPLTPVLAAEKEGVVLTLSQVIEAGLPLTNRHSALIVEGAGGLAAPLTENELVADLIIALKLPMLLVARPGLGTINHTLLSLFFARRHNIPVAGVIINGYRDAETISDESLYTNAEMIKKYGNVDILGKIPWLSEEPTNKQLTEMFEQNVDLDKIASFCRNYIQDDRKG